MNIIKAFPVISILLGSFLTFFILFTKNNFSKNTLAKYSLATVMFLYTLLSVGTYIDSVEYDVPLFLNSISFVSFVFIGISFYYFCTAVFNKKIQLVSTLFIILYGIFKTCFFYYLVDQVGTERNEIEKLFIPPYVAIIEYAIYDYIVSCIINLYFIYRAYKIFSTTSLIIHQDKKQDIYFKWINLLFYINFAVILALLIQIVLVLFGIGTLDIIFTIEPIVYTLYFFVFVYSLMYFPVFAFTGDYNDLPKEEKYKNSSLNDSAKLFNKIHILVTEEQLFLSSELKINTLSERLDTSVPHISQAINENKQMSFSDYINSFRIEEAKKRLLVKKPDTIFAIAIDVGFNNKSTFYHAFKKLTNTTPTEFRKHMK